MSQEYSKNGNKSTEAFVSAGKSWTEYIHTPWKEQFAALPSGVNLCYLTMGPEAGTPLLLLHGAGDNRISWMHVAPKLAEKGYRVYVPEHRGHGKSSVILNTRGYYLAEDYMIDTLELMDHLGLERAHLVGHSLGTLISQSIAIHHPERVCTITLLAAGPNSSLTSFRDTTVGEEEIFDDTFKSDWATCFHEDENFCKAEREYVMQLTMEQWRRILNGIKYYNNQDYLYKITCPVQLIWGTEDAVFNEDIQQILLDGMKNAEVKFVRWEGASHSPHWDSYANTDRLVELVHTFVDAHL